METLPCQKKLKRSQGKIVVIHHHLIHHHSWSEQLLGNVADVGILELLRTIASLHQYLCSKMIQRDSEQNEFVTSEWGVPEMGLFFGVSEGLTPLLLEPQQPIIQSQWLSCHGLLWLLSAIVFFCFAKLAPVFDSNHCNLSWRKCQTWTRVTFVLFCERLPLGQDPGIDHQQLGFQTKIFCWKRCYCEALNS